MLDGVCCGTNQNAPGHRLRRARCTSGRRNAFLLYRTSPVGRGGRLNNVRQLDRLVAGRRARRPQHHSVLSCRASKCGPGQGPAAQCSSANHETAQATGVELGSKHVAFSQLRPNLPSGGPGGGCCLRFGPRDAMDRNQRETGRVQALCGGGWPVLRRAASIATGPKKKTTPEIKLSTGRVRLWRHTPRLGRSWTQGGHTPPIGLSLRWGCLVLRGCSWPLRRFWR